MMTKEKFETRVGRIPSGHAAYEAEAIEYGPRIPAVASELGHVAVGAAVEQIETEAS